MIDNDSAFFVLMNNLTNHEPGEYLKRVFFAFHAIATMDPQETVAAYNTLKYFGEEACFKDSSLVTKLESAVKNRMVTLVADESGEDYRAMFEAALNNTQTLSSSQ